MSESMKPFEGQLQLSSNLDYFRNGDEFYVYHNLFGYILKMSHDVIEFLEYFRPEPRDATDALQHFHGRFSDDMIGEFANVLAIQSCLLAPDETEETKLMKMHPMHARWITVHDPDDGPVTIYALDQETKAHIYVARLDGWDSQLWRAINGEKTVAELVEEMRNVSGSPVQGLEQRVLATLAQLTHCDMQVLKMSGQPASTYKHRRHGTPPYLISTMPYEKVTAELSPAGGGPVVAVSGRKTEAIDEELLESSGIREFEQIHLYNLANGERFTTYAIRAAAGSRIISVNGAAAHKAAPGDRVIICAYVSMSEGQAAAFRPRLVYLNEYNQITGTGDAIPAQAA